jgi:hypothetical protein
MKMNSLVKGAAVVFVIGGIAAGALYNSATASPTAESEVKATVQHYFQAIKQGNVEEMMKLTDDKRFKNDEAKRSVYSSLVRAEELQDEKITNITPISGDRINVTLHSKTKGQGIQDMTIPVVRENGEWKLLIEGQVVENNNN